MRFEVSHTFQGISLDDYEKLYFDEPFNEALCKAVRLERELVSLEDDGRRIRRVVRVAPDRQLPKPVARALGGAKIAYTEHVDYARGSYEGTWRTDPSLLKEKIASSGRFGFREKDGGVERWVEGDVTVKIFGVGGMIEKLIVEDVRRSYDDAAAFTRSWLRERA